jgi:hypothetical protein
MPPLARAGVGAGDAPSSRDGATATGTASLAGRRGCGPVGREVLAGTEAAAAARAPEAPAGARGAAADAPTASLAACAAAAGAEAGFAAPGGGGNGV